MEKIVDKFDEVKTAIDNLCNGEDNAMKLWNEYVDAYADNVGYVKIYRNLPSVVADLAKTTDNPIGCVVSALTGYTAFDNNDRYVYVSDGKLYSTNSIYNEVNVYELFYYAVKCKNRR